MFYEFRKFYCLECEKMIYVEAPETRLHYCPFCGAEETVMQGLLTFPYDPSVQVFSPVPEEEYTK